MHILIDLIQTLVFGMTAGITEWLPVSEGAHMMVLETIWPFSYESFYALFHAFIRIGSAVAVLYVYHGKLLPFLVSGAEQRKRRQGALSLWLCIAAASIPVCVLSVCMTTFVRDWLNAPFVFCVTLIAYGIILILIGHSRIPERIGHLEQLNGSTALRIGLFMCLAVVPGTSLYAAALIGALLLGCSKSVAARFGAMASMPVLVVYMIETLSIYIYNGSRISLYHLLILLAGCLAAFAASVLVLKVFTAFVRDHSLDGFGWYRIVFGILIFLAFAM